MKKITLFLMLIQGIVYGQGSQGFQLKGNIEGLKNGSILFLKNSKNDTICVSNSVGSYFEFNGFVKGAADYYFLRIDSFKNVSSKALWLENKKLNLTGKLIDWPNLTLTGSESHNEYVSLLKATENKGIKEKKAISKEFIKKHKNSLYIASLISKVCSPAEMNEAFEQLTPRAKQSLHGIKLGEELKSLKSAILMDNKAAKNEVIPNFEFTLLDGRKTSILEIAKKSKFTLIDFWASWCKPCREAVPEMKRTYNTFYKKGFNILGVSTDVDQTSWRKAIEKDSTNWTHGLDNITHAGKNVFSLIAIPAYILINREGKIISTDYFSSSSSPIRVKKPRDNRLGTHLYSIVEELLKQNDSPGK